MYNAGIDPAVTFKVVRDGELYNKMASLMAQNWWLKLPALLDSTSVPILRSTSSTTQRNEPVFYSLSYHSSTGFHLCSCFWGMHSSTNCLDSCVFYCQGIHSSTPGLNLWTTPEAYAPAFLLPTPVYFQGRLLTTCTFQYYWPQLQCVLLWRPAFQHSWPQLVCQSWGRHSITTALKWGHRVYWTW